MRLFFLFFTMLNFFLSTGKKMPYIYP